MNYEHDTQTLMRDELHRLSATINAMGNSDGGIITLEGGEVISVEACQWFARPQRFNGHVWRRVEGENVRCGLWSRAVMAEDAHTLSADDFPVNSRINAQDLASYRERVVTRREEYACFARDEFARRAGVYSGRHLTFAGALMFGEVLRVRAELHHEGIHAHIERPNIWEAYTQLLPKLTRALSALSTEAVSEAVTYALLNADYTLGKNININIHARPARLEVEAPGIIRPDLRNHRLARMFGLAGINIPARPQTLRQDMTDFRMHSTILIEANSPIML